MWSERFYFNVSDPSSIQELVLEARVYNTNKSKGTKSSLGTCFWTEHAETGKTKGTTCPRIEPQAQVRPNVLESKGGRLDVRETSAGEDPPIALLPNVPYGVEQVAAPQTFDLM